LADLRAIIGTAIDEGIRVRAYISTAFGCPYEGHVAPDRVLDLARRLFDLGAERVVLGDTIGTGLPDQVEAMVASLGEVGVAPDRLALHAHDTRGTALVNVYAAWRAGLTHFDASVAGIGGCPYAPGASGNLATEDVVHLFEGMGVATGIDLAALVDAGRGMATALGRPLPGRVHQALAGATNVSLRSAKGGG
jgi:hydroxymethylglutaryl-CoA lyase